LQRRCAALAKRAQFPYISIVFSDTQCGTFEVDRGEFHCPNCRTKTTYRRYEQAEYRRIMFVLKVKGEVLGTFIVCDKCERSMKDEDLRGTLPSDTRILLTALKEKLRTGQSVQDATKALTEAGMIENEAHRLVRAAAGIVLHRCVQCSRTYVDDVAKCAHCGILLPTCKN
jgi:hypothetical protein